MSLSARLAALLAVLVLLAGIAWKIDHGGYQRSENKWLAKESEAKDKLAAFNENQRHIERGWQAQSTKAQNDRIKKEQDLQPVIAASRNELDGLRSDIYSLDTSASRESTSTCIARASAARAVFEQCAQKYTDLAKRADGHAADAVMLQEAWPK